MADDLDPGLLSQVQGFEGFAPVAKWDYKQYTNGYGTKAAYPGEQISREDAQGRLQDELAKAQAHVDSLGVPMTQGWRRALTDLTFNGGTAWSNGSGLGEAVKRGDWDEAAKHFAEYNKAGGIVNPALVQRRAADLQMAGVDPNQYQPPMPPAATRGITPRPPSNIGQPMSDTYAAQDQGALAAPTQQQQRLSPWDSMGPALEKAAYFLMGPQTAGHAAEVDRQQAEKHKQNWQVVSEDPWTGAKQYGFVNPYTGQVSRPGQSVGTNPNTAGGPALAGVQGQQAQMSPGQISQKIDQIRQQGGSTDDMLKSIDDPMVRQMVQDAGNYQFDPTKLGGRGAQMKNTVLGLGEQIYGPEGFSRADYDARHKYTTDVGSNSPDQKRITAGNLALNHLATYADESSKLGQRQAPFEMLQGPYNSLQHGFSSTSDPNSYAAHEGAMDQTAANLAGEMHKLFAGTTVGVNQVEDLTKRLSPSNTSAGDRIAAIQTAREMIDGQLQVMRDKRDQIFHGVAPEKLDQRYQIGISPADSARYDSAMSALSRNPGGFRGPSAQAGSAGAPKPGKYRYNPQTGNLDPM